MLVNIGIAGDTLDLEGTAFNRVDQPGGHWHTLEVMDFPHIKD